MPSRAVERPGPVAARPRLWLALALTFGCGGKTSELSGGIPPAGPAEASGGTAASGNELEPPAAAGTPAPSMDSRPCVRPLGSPEDLARSPRADENLELLALELEPDSDVVSQATYERVVTDVALIRGLQPLLAPIRFRAPHDGRSLLIFFNPGETEALGAGADAGWDCLNEAYGSKVTAVTDAVPVYSPNIELRGIYNLPRVAALYAEVPGIDSAEFTEYSQNGPTWCIGRNGERYEYVIDRASGGCSTGCRDHEAHHFESLATGEVTELEVWRSLDGEPAPGWYSALCL